MRNHRRSPLAIICLMTLLAAHVSASVEVEDVRLWRAPDHTRVVLDLSGPTTHKVLELANPSRLVLDVSDASLAGALTDLPLDGTPIARVRSGIREGQDLRVVFDLSADVNPKSFQLAPNERTGHRLVLDLFDAETSKQPVIAAPKKTVKKRTRVALSWWPLTLGTGVRIRALQDPKSCVRNMWFCKSLID